MTEGVGRLSPASRVMAVWIGVVAALRAPRWVRGHRVERLLEEGRGAVGPEGTSEPTRTPPPAAVFGVRIARALLRRLAWLPRSPWRNTCLYRSVAECLILRHYGVPAAIRLGVRRQATGEVGSAASVPGLPGAGRGAPVHSPDEGSSSASRMAESSSIVAHAWVVYPGCPDGDDVMMHVPLVAAAPPRL